MKNRLLYIILVLGLFSTSCTDQLQVSDPDSLSQDLALSNIIGFEGVINSAHNRVIAFGWMGQNGLVAPDVLADNMDFTNFTGRFEDEYQNAVRAHMARWANYRCINECNIVLDKIDGLELTDEQEIKDRDRYKGEAHFLRAYAYHEMAKIYGYEPGKEVNGFNLTVPLRTMPTDGLSDAFDVKARASNTEMYAQIESDLNAAITLLTGADAVDSPFRANLGAARALLARVLLYKGDYAGAGAAADAAMSATTATLASGNAYTDSWGAAIHPESVFEAEIRVTDWNSVDGANNSVSTLTNDFSPSSQFILVGSEELMNDLDSEAGDIRSQLWISQSGIPAGTRKCDKWRGEQGDFRENLPLIRVSEIMLTAAEGYARGGNEGLGRDRINTFRAARGLAPTALGGSDLINLIMKERRVELAFEGHRWFDLKRLGMDITKTARSGAPTLIYANDFRLLADLPTAELSLNDLLTQNPGY